MNEKTMRIWQDIGGLDELFLDELESEIAEIAAKANKRRKIKIGAIAATAATLSAAVAFVVLKQRHIATKNFQLALSA